MGSIPVGATNLKQVPGKATARAEALAGHCL